jgi:uncharacterized protein
MRSTAVRMMAAAALAVPWPAQAQSTGAASTAIEAPGPNGPLAGTLLAAGAGAGAPAMLIIPGSGPTDRDGNSPQGLRAAPYRLLAEALAARGITSVRIDKRGMFGSKAAIPDPNQATIDAYADDVHAWIKVIRARTGARCVWLAGHSEGGMVALAAARRPDGICGVILIATPGRPFGVIIREQLQALALDDESTAQVDAALASLGAGRPVEPADIPPMLASLFSPAIQPYLIDLMAQDPVGLAAAYRGPMLIVSGGRDIQVSAADAAALRAARPDAESIRLAQMTHVLKQVDSDDRAANIATYTDPARPLAPGVAEAIAAFVTAHPPGR